MKTTSVTVTSRASDSSSLWSRLRHGRTVLHAEPDWPEFAGTDWSATIMAESVTDRFHAKQGRSIARWTLRNDDRELIVYLKRHYELPRLRGWLAALLPSRAWSPGLEEWEHLNWARAEGFWVPRAVAVAEWLHPGGRLQGFLAVEELAGMLALHEAIPLAHDSLSPADFARWKRGLIAELARLSRELHRRQTFHQDLYLCHFYVATRDCKTVPSTWTGNVAMIDFHRLAHHTLGSRYWQIKDLAQLLYSTFDVKVVTPRDQARFWKLYREGDWNSQGTPAGWMTRVIRFRADRYHRKNLRRQAQGGK